MRHILRELKTKSRRKNLIRVFDDKWKADTPMGPMVKYQMISMFKGEKYQVVIDRVVMSMSTFDERPE